MAPKRPLVRYDPMDPRTLDLLYERAVRGDRDAILEMHRPLDAPPDPAWTTGAKTNRSRRKPRGTA